MTFRHVLLVAAGIAFISSGRLVHSENAPPTFTAAELRADLVELKRALHDMPPDLYRTADSAQLERAFLKIEADLDSSPPLDRDAAWRLFAMLNPLLADGHLFIGFVDWRGDTRAHVAGGRLFPIAVRVTPDCELTVRGNPPPSAMLRPQPGARIVKINGMPADEICAAMMARAHGDTRVFRADLLSRRFWFFYWKLYGAAQTYDVLLDPGGTQRFEGSTNLPEVLADEQDFDRQFDLTFIAPVAGGKADPHAVILKLGTFAWPDKNQVLAFTRTAFENIRRSGVKILIIDLRDNGGGNDEEWIEGVMPYIATRRWRTASAYRKRVVVSDPGRGEVAGAVIDGAIETWYAPQPRNPLHFDGDVYVAVGPGTYSSAVVMSTVIQDFGFGRVIGSKDSVRANSSGGTRRTTLTHSGLIVVAPRFVLTRPSGATQPVLLTPDIPYGPRQSLVDFASEHSDRTHGTNSDDN